MRFLYKFFSMVPIIVCSAVALIVGFIVGYVLFQKVITGKKDRMMKEALADIEAQKKNKMLEAKEHFMHLRSEHEAAVNERNARVQQAENRIKQKEASLSQRFEDVQRQKKEVETLRDNLNAQKEALETRTEELARQHRLQVERLEALSGLSAEEAKAQLVESLKAEAKTEAMSYVNEVMDEAKMTASKEAKSIVIKTIQRVATETAIENAD